MTSFKNYAICFILAFVFSPLPSPIASPSAIEALDAEIPTLMEAWEVPGLALAVVQDGEILLSRGYGVLEMGGKATVNPDTLFAIGSITKSFTAACLGMLVDEGKIGWDDPVADHLPFFALKDPWISRMVTIRDFLSHRSGVAPDMLIYWGTPLGRNEIIRRLRYCDINGFRSSFQYNNLTYLAAGQVIPAVTGQSWDDCVRQRIFTPLGMPRSTVSNRDFAGDDNVASSHLEGKEEPRPCERLDLDNDAPAGSIYSTANEMANWLLVHLQDGKVNGKKILPESVVREMRTPQNSITDPALALQLPDANLAAYGFGWNMHDYHGHLLVQHGGGTRGMTAQVGMIPSKGFGVVVLSNAQYSHLPPLIAYKVYDALLGREGRDWNAHFEELRRQTEEWFASFTPPRAHEGTSLSLDEAAYAGNYHDQYYGPAVVWFQDGKLTIELTDLGYSGTLSHRHYDTFNVSWETDKQSIIQGVVPQIQFTLDINGQIEILVAGSSKFRRLKE